MEWLQALESVSFWKSLLAIVVVDIVVSGDNAVVIALVARGLPPAQQRAAIVYGTLAAILLRVTLTFFASELLQFVYVKLVGAVLLLWIGAKLLVPPDQNGEGGEEGEGPRAAASLAGAVRTILIADFAMSLDNVIAVASAAETGPAETRLSLLLLGLGLSIPLMIIGSRVLLRLMGRWPVIITLGAALMGFVAGEMAISDPAVVPWVEAHWVGPHWLAAVAGALFVVVAGRTWARRVAARRPPVGAERQPS